MTKKTTAVPLSEDQRKFHPEWTKEDCIKHLRTIAEANPDQVITRNFFRVHSNISESTWNRYFGTFHEFKRQANIVLSRHAHRHEKDIAKHASKDKMRALMADKTGWEGEYLRPDKKRFQTMLAGSDMHDVECDPFYRRLFVETAKRVQPEKIVLNGDIFDLTEFSRFTQDPREFKPVERIKWVHKLLEDLRDAAPNAEITFVEGNHEFRLMRHLAEATPALVTVLADLHGLSIPALLGLSKFEVNYIARMDLSAFTERDINKELSKNYYIAWDCVLAHHFPEGRQMGMPGFNGHHHKQHVWPAFSPIFGSFVWHQIGAGHFRHASYCNGEKWSNGFILEHVDTKSKSVAAEYIDVRDHAVIGGVIYTRRDDERAPLSVTGGK